ncbi:MAG: hypothetical protein II951_00320 [Bacteroidales bacterium]|nr:hypothetical protein [Bacteroidales bacterium]
MKLLNSVLLLLVSILNANEGIAEDSCFGIVWEQVKSEIVIDSLTYRAVDIDKECDCKEFYVGDACIVHIHQHCSGVMDAAIQRYYRFNDGQWKFVREESSLNYECEQIGSNLFHAYSYKNASKYEAFRYEAVMICEGYALKPIFEYEGVDYTNYLFSKYVNGDLAYFSKYLGETICNDYIVSLNPQQTSRNIYN